MQAGKGEDEGVGPVHRTGLSRFVPYQLYGAESQSSVKGSGPGAPHRSVQVCPVSVIRRRKPE